MTETRPPLPPFGMNTALQRVRAAEDAWNTRDPEEVALAHKPDSVRRNRDTFVTGRVLEFPARNWEKEQDHALRKGLWNFRGNGIAVRFQYEWHDR